MSKPLEIFRSGRHVAMSGEAISFSDSDLDAICASYDPAVHEAPIVIGHPKDNAPAFGWVKSLARKGNALQAAPHQVDASFAEAVKAGRYKKISASFYKPDSPSNPKPGSFYLRHVGFLGAMPPAVKGLREASFAGSDADTVTIDFAEDAPAAAGSPDLVMQMKAMLAWITATYGDDAAVKAQAAAATAPPPAAPEEKPKETPTTEHAEGDLDPKALTDGLDKALDGLTSGADAEMVTALKKAIADAVLKALAPPAPGDGPAEPANLGEGKPKKKTARELELDAREANLAKREKENRHGAHASFLETLLRAGRPLPEKKEALVTLMSVLEGDDKPSEASFGETDKRKPLDVFRDILRRIPKEIVFGELVDGELDATDENAVARAAVAYQEEQHRKGNIITTSDAVRHVSGKGV